jgi:hypothetical protein
MKKRWLACGLVFVSVTVWLAGSAGSSGAAGIQDYARATDFEPGGITIDCDVSPCPIPLYTVWTFRLDTIGTPYDAVVTASFTYQTSKGLRVNASPNLFAGTARVTLPFSDRPLSPSPNPRSVTLTWLVSDLGANTEYGLYLSILPSGPPPPAYNIDITDTTLVVEGAPA